MGQTRRHHSHGTRPGFVKLTHTRATEIFPIHRRTFGLKLARLAEAKLIEIHQPRPNAARQVRVVPLSTEEYQTRVWLGLPRE
jgi:hypothetical protein